MKTKLILIAALSSLIIQAQAVLPLSSAHFTTQDTTFESASGPSFTILENKRSIRGVRGGNK